MGKLFPKERGERALGIRSPWKSIEFKRIICLGTNPPENIANNIAHTRNYPAKIIAISCTANTITMSATGYVAA